MTHLLGARTGSLLVQLLSEAASTHVAKMGALHALEALSVSDEGKVAEHSSCTPLQ